MFLVKSRKFVFIMVSIMVTAVLLTACGDKKESTEASTTLTTTAAPSETTLPEATSTAPAAAEKTVKDALGNRVTIPANPTRIIASYLEDPLVALGVIPVAQWSVPNGTQEYLKKELAGVPTISYGLPYEEVTSFNPDLLIIASNSEVEGDKYAQYAKITPTYTLGNEINSDWRKALLKIGEILNKSDLAQKALDQYEAKAKEAKAKINSAVGTQSATALWLVQKQFYVVSESLSSGSVMYNDLGLTAPDVVKEISKTGTGNWNAISLEKLAEMKVDHIFLIDSDKAEGSTALKDPLWQNIPAVKKGHVFEFDSTHSWLYSGAIANSKIIDDVLASLVK